MIKYECPYCSMQVEKMEERCPYCGAPGKEFKEIIYSEPQPATFQGNYIQEEAPKRDISHQGKDRSISAVICLVCGFISIGSMCTLLGWVFAIVGVVTFIVTITDKETSRRNKILAKVGFGLSLATLIFSALVFVVFLISA